MSEFSASLDLSPVSQEDGVVAWEIAGETVTVRRSGTGWDYTGPGADVPLHVSELGDPPLRFASRVASDEAVARFASPVFVAPSAQAKLWIAWPLEVVVLAGDVELDEFIVGRRKTLFGTVSDGRVLATAICDPVVAPDAEELRGRPFAALRVTIRNRSAEPARVSRVPVIGGMLALHRKNGSFAATSVDVTLHEGGGAEATSSAGPAPDGFRTVAAARRRPGQAGHLGWLLDATRRSVEYPL